MKYFNKNVINILINGEMRFYYDLLECKISIVVADGRYKDCKTKFHLRSKDNEMLKEIDHGFLKVSKKSRDRKIWTSAKLHKLYLDDNDVINDCRTFIEKLFNYFNGDLIPFKNRGYLSWIVFKDHAMVVKIQKIKVRKILLSVLGISLQKNARKSIW